VETAVTTVGTSSTATTSAATAYSTTTTGGTVVVTETDTFTVLLTRIVRELHRFANEAWKLLGLRPVVTPLGWRVRQVIVTVKPLTVTPTSPPDGGTVPKNVPLTLQAQVTSGGQPVQGATVKFVVDGRTVCIARSGSNGMASCRYRPTLGAHTYSWYAVADKPQYAHAQSPTWTFKTT
jgi:hypothetical protein